MSAGRHCGRLGGADDEPGPGRDRLAGHPPDVAYADQGKVVRATVRSAEEMAGQARQVVAIASARSRPGVRFLPLGELDLHPEVKLLAHSLPFPGDRLFLIEEPPGPVGMPDFVGVYGDEAAVLRRAATGVPPLLNQVDAGLVQALSSTRPLSATTLARKTGWDEHTVHRRLPGLIATGAIERSRNNTYTRQAGLAPLGVTIAFELKLSDWQRAVRQGRLYSSWCDSYALIMADLSPTVRSRALDAVALDGGGLAINGRWYTRPRRRPPMAKMWGSEHLFAALSDHQPSSEIKASQP